jgi:tellurite resistance-related uncharacterized protein
MIGMQLKCPNPANTMIWEVYAYCESQPRVDWGDNTPYEAVPIFAANAAPDMVDTWKQTHTYTAKGPKEVRVFDSKGAYTHLNIFTGDVPYFDPDARRLTQAERWQLEADKAKAMAQPKAWIGPDNNSAAPGGTVVAPETKLADS